MLTRTLMRMCPAEDGALKTQEEARERGRFREAQEKEDGEGASHTSCNSHFPAFTVASKHVKVLPMVLYWLPATSLRNDKT